MVDKKLLLDGNKIIRTQHNLIILPNTTRTR